MIQRILFYYHNTVHPRNYCVTALKRKHNNKLKIGFCLKFLQNETDYHGFAFPNQNEIAEKILYLKTHEKIRESMDKNGRERVIQKYHLKNVINSLIEYCQKLQRRDYESSYY